MLAEFLLPQTTVRDAGAGPVMTLGRYEGSVLILTLGITRIIEQESLDLSVWGSADGTEWGSHPIVAFPQKFYCGTYQVPLDLIERPDVKFLRVQWHVNRWGKGDPTPLFEVYVFAKQMRPASVAVAGA